MFLSLRSGLWFGAKGIPTIALLQIAVGAGIPWLWGRLWYGRRLSSYGLKYSRILQYWRPVASANATLVVTTKNVPALIPRKFLNSWGLVA